VKTEGEPFLNGELLRQRVADVSKKYGIRNVARESVDYLDSSCQNWYKKILTELI